MDKGLSLFFREEKSSVVAISQKNFGLQAIQEAIDTFQKKNETFKMASREQHLEDPVSWILYIFCHFD